MDSSLPGSFVHGIFQARVLEWVVISFSRRSAWPRDWTRVSCTVGRHLTVWATREVLTCRVYQQNRNQEDHCRSWNFASLNSRYIHVITGPQSHGSQHPQRQREAFELIKSMFLAMLPACMLSLQSCLTLCDAMLARLLCPWDSAGKRVGSHWSGLLFPSPEDLPNPGIRPVSLYISCTWILYW